MKKAITEVTMREFRAAPAKRLLRAARSRTPLRVGALVISVQESAVGNDAKKKLHGCMSETGMIVGDRRKLLSADDQGSTDA